MDAIRICIEGLMQMIGLTGSFVSLTSHTIMVLATFAIAALADYVCIRFVVPLIQKITVKTAVTWDDKILNRTVLASFCHIIPAILVWILLPKIFSRYLVVEEILKRMTAIYITVMLARSFVVMIELFKTLENEKHAAMQQYFHSFCGLLKIVLIFVASIVIVSIIIGSSPLTIFAGLGATSAVLMLVFKDTIEGFVAGIRLTSNDMLRRGDWITVPAAGANGTVEELTLSTVKIRNFDNSIVTVSPQALVNGSFQNWVGMQQSDGRRVSRNINYDFDSIRIIDDTIKQNLVDRGYFKVEELAGKPVNIALFRQYLQQYITDLPEVNAEMSVLVHQLPPTTQGLPIEFYFFLYEKDWLKHEQQVSAIMEYIYAISPDFGLRIFQLSFDKCS